MADVVTGDARDLFVAIASAAAALIGLLFVAITVTPRPAGGRPRSVIHQVRSAAALLAFTNALGVSLFGLVPDNNAGWPATAFGIVGVLFTLASVRSMLADPKARPQFVHQIALILALLAVFITQIVYGARLLENWHNHVALDTIDNVLIGSLLLGIARAWEFVGDRDTGVWSSVATLITGQQRHLLTPDSIPAEPAEPAEPGESAD
jgi:hypothetical protein